jgi:hypothetical protein
MNDPHVVALVYRVEHDEHVDYKRATPLEFEAAQFKVRVADGVARFELKVDCATEEKARALVDPFARAWQIRAEIGLSPSVFRLTFQRAEVIDRFPQQDGVVSAVGRSGGRAEVAGHGQIVLSKYPEPPCGFDVLPELEVAYEAWRALWPKQHFLPALGYLVLTMLEAGAPPGKGGSQLREQAAKSYDVEYDVLKKLGELTAKGGPYARKHKGMCQPFSPEEETWLWTVIPVLMRRMGEREHDPIAILPQIAMADLPPLP